MKTTNKKSSRIGLYSVILSVVVIVVLVLVNAVISALPATSTRFDTTNYDFYDFSEETAKLVSAIKKPVTLTLVSESGSEEKYIAMLLEKYASLNSDVKYATVDPVLHPTYKTMSGETVKLGEAGENSVIVESDLKYKVIGYDEIYTTQYTEEELYYAYMQNGAVPDNPQYFNGEVVITSAMEYVTSEDIPTVYCVTGHNEVKLNDSLSGYLNDDNYTLKTFSLMTDETVPEDADAIVFNVPSADISARELEALEKYIDGGGKVVMVTTFTEGFEKTENIHALAEYMGLTLLDGMAVETSAANYFSGYPIAIAPDIAPHDITSGLDAKYIAMPGSHGMIKSENAPEGVTVTDLLITTDGAFMTNGEDISEDAATYKGKITLGAICEKGEGALVWYSCYGITDEQCDSMVSGTNSELFISTLNNLCEKEASVSVAAKQMVTEHLTISDGASTAWGIILCAVIPLAVVAAGISVWLIRKKR